MNTTVDHIELDEALPSENSGLAPLIARDMNLIKHVQVELIAELGKAEITVDELFALRAGDVVKLQEQVNTPVVLSLHGKAVARGTLVAVDDNFGIQLTEIL